MQVHKLQANKLNTLVKRVFPSSDFKKSKTLNKVYGLFFASVWKFGSLKIWDEFFERESGRKGRHRLRRGCAVDEPRTILSSKKR